MDLLQIQLVDLQLKNTKVHTKQGELKLQKYLRLEHEEIVMLQSQLEQLKLLVTNSLEIWELFGNNLEVVVVEQEIQHMEA